MIQTIKRWWQFNPTNKYQFSKNLLHVSNIQCDDDDDDDDDSYNQPIILTNLKQPTATTQNSVAL